MTQQWKLVPVEPTEEQVKACSHDDHGGLVTAWYRRAIYAAMLAAAPTPTTSAQDDAKDERQPLFWYRPRSDDGYEGPIHNDRIEDVRKQSGAWVPLYPSFATLPKPLYDLRYHGEFIRGWNQCLREASESNAAPALGDAKDQREAMPTVVPDAIRLMAQRIAADKFEHCTVDPIFTVMKRRLITGLDLDYDCEVGWFYDGERITGDDAAALEAEYQEEFKVPSNYTRTGIAEEWEHHATYVTMEAAQEFVKAKGDQYRVYVDSGCRNHEWQVLRAFLLDIAASQQQEG